MKIKMMVEVEVDDGTSADVVADDLSKLVRATDGEQHLDTMNWAPTEMRSPVVTPMNIVSLGKPHSLEELKDMPYAALLVEQVRQKVFAVKLRDCDDANDICRQIDDELRNAADNGELDFTDAPVAFYQTAWMNGVERYDGGLVPEVFTEWDEFWDRRKDKQEIPVEMLPSQE